MPKEMLQKVQTTEDSANVATASDRMPVDRRCELEIGTGAGVENERGRSGAEDRRGVDRDE